MTSPDASTTVATRLGRDRERRSQERLALVRRHGELSQALAHLRRLTDRLDDTGADPHSRRLAAAIIEQLDELLPDVLARESRSLPASSDASSDAWLQQATDHLRADQGWITANWLALRPLVDGVACGQSWVDLDQLHEAAELFGALQREHVALAATVLARQDRRRPEEAPAVAAH